MNKKISFPIAIIIIIVCAVLVGGIVVYQYYGMPKEQEEAPEEKVSEDETADWKTYRNEEYGVEIDYPADGWEFEEYYRGAPTIFGLCKEQVENEKEETCIFATIKIIYHKCHDLSLTEIIENSECFMQYAWLMHFEEEITTNSGVKGVRARGLDGAKEAVGVFFLIPEKVFDDQTYPVLFFEYFLGPWGHPEIRYPFASEKDKILNQMLSTFKFIEVEIVEEDSCKDLEGREKDLCYYQIAKEKRDSTMCDKIQTLSKEGCYEWVEFLLAYDEAEKKHIEYEIEPISNWETFKSNELGFEVKYPPDFTLEEEDNITKFSFPEVNFHDTNLYLEKSGILITKKDKGYACSSFQEFEDWGYIKIITPNGDTFYQSTWPGAGCGSGYCELETSYYTIYNNYCYTIKLMIAYSSWSSPEFGAAWGRVSFNKESLEETFSQMLSTFRFIGKEIQTGKLEIDYDRVNELQKAVDEGHQPWRLNPYLVVKSEALQYGFTEDDIKTIYIPHISSEWVLGRDITSLPAEITHNDREYIITVSQPVPGELKIWTISEIQEK